MHKGIQGVRLTTLLKEIKRAVILAGGAGLRLRPLTNDRPKAMVELLGKPILQWIIEWLKSNGIAHVIIGVAYRKESIIDYFGDGSRFGVKIEYSVHGIKGETAEGFRLAISRYVNDDFFIAMNGDQITNFNLRELVDYHRKHDPIATIAVTNPRCAFGIIRTNESGLVLSFEEKPIIPSLLVNTGIYLFNHRIVSYLPENGLIEETTFPLLAKRKLLRVYHFKGAWSAVNTMKDLKLAESTLRKEIEDGRWLK